MKFKILVLVLICAFSFSGCNNAGKEASDDIKDLSRPAQEQQDSLDDGTKEAGNEQAENDGLLKTVREAILEKCEIKDSLPLETDALERLYAIDTATVKQSAGFVTMSGTFPHEVIMIEAVDSEAADVIVSKLQNRHSEVMLQSKSYDAKNYALALECKVVKDGNFISMFLSPDHKKITEVYNEYIK